MRPLTNSQVPRKVTRISQKIRLEKSKNKAKKFPKKYSKSKGKKRKRNDSDSEDDKYDWYDKYCAICKAKGLPFWNNDTKDCRTLTGFRKKKQRATQGMTKKEFHALVNTQWKRFIEGKIRIPGPKRPKIPMNPP